MAIFSYCVVDILLNLITTGFNPKSFIFDNFCPGGAPNYFPNSFQGPQDGDQFKECPFSISGDVKRYETSDEDNYSQVSVFFNKVRRELH